MNDLPAFAAELLYQGRVARLGTADRAGQPLVLPVCYVFDGRACFSAIDAKPKRLQARPLRRVRNIAENPRVSLTVDRYDEEWSRLAWVVAPRYRSTLAGLLIIVAALAAYLLVVGHSTRAAYAQVAECRPPASSSPGSSAMGKRPAKRSTKISHCGR